ncbi:MAG: NUDIX hydrolase [Chlorobi bacterium]|nr:NUDIX hydrolase [Chlorobiota bacterium]
MKKESSYCYKYPRPAYTSDCLVFVRTNGIIKILLIKRKNNPFKDYYALPGGFVDEGETSYKAAIRELKEETGLEVDKVNFFGVFDTPGRDPRGWTISAVYYVFIEDKVAKKSKAGDDASGIKLFLPDKLPSLAFDHKKIVEKAVKKLTPIIHK